MSLDKVRRELRQFASPAKAKILQSFFKTGPGEYGEGDLFLGVVVPQTRQVVRANRDLSLAEIKMLLESKYHEERLTAVLLLVYRYPLGEEREREKIFRFYLRHRKHINNWDLIDSSAGPIVGAHLRRKNKSLLYDLARSPKLWDRRIAIVSTQHLIGHREFSETVKIAKLLLKDEEDLIHKATGWMLREVGKRDVAVLENFLKAHCTKMPRTMLRYSIERLPEARRKAYLKGTI